VCGEHLTGLHQLLGSLPLGFGTDDAGTSVTFGFRLARDGADRCDN
jgi:hypothetical protein